MKTTYETAVRNFDHEDIANLPSYTRLRQVLSDISNEAGEHGSMKLGRFLDELHNMAATAPYGDMCRTCHDAIYWPYKVIRDGNYVRGTYRCEAGHVWTCNYHIGLAGL